MKDRLKGISMVIKIIVGSIAILAAVFLIDRPVLYRAEFLPVAADVIELVAENTHAKWVRADEQVKRRQARIERAGGKATAEEREALRLWKATLFALERKLLKLKPEK